MKLDERKLKILQAVIHSYILNAEPVGSRTISKKYNLGVSSATIRNEMSDLEELGYLLQPHTSAGRIPSDKGYRLYVDNLMKLKALDGEEKKVIKKSLFREMGELDAIIQNAAKILSKLTNYTSLAIAPQLKQTKLKHIQLVPVDSNKILAVIVTDSGIIKNTLLRVDREIDIEHLNKISNFLTANLKGYRLEEISFELEESLLNEMYDFRDTINDTLNNIIPLINRSIEGDNKIELYSNGVTNIFNFPEYNDIDKAKTFLAFLEDKNSVVDMLLKNGFHDIEITIGNENCYQQVKNCSLITATYRLNGKTIGKIGVIGPTRMNYSKVVSIVKSISANLNDILKEHFLK